MEIYLVDIKANRIYLAAGDRHCRDLADIPPGRAFSFTTRRNT